MVADAARLTEIVYKLIIVDSTYISRGRKTRVRYDVVDLLRAVVVEVLVIYIIVVLHVVATSAAIATEDGRQRWRGRRNRRGLVERCWLLLLLLL